jgi:hypothetical protein
MELMTGSFDIWAMCESLHHMCRTSGGGLSSLRLYRAPGIRVSIVNIFLDVDVFYVQNKERTKYVNLTSRSGDI